MRHKVAGTKLNRTSSHRNAMFRNMVTSLILNDRIETTVPKAKELRRWADKMITLAKKNTLHARRQAITVLRDKNALQKLFSTLVDRYRDREGGYTRIMKLGTRQGDSAPMAIIEYLTAEVRKVVGGKASEKKASAPKKKISESKTKSAVKKAVEKKVTAKKTTASAGKKKTSAKKKATAKKTEKK